MREKNGKDLRCKICNKQFYISNSRLVIRKYCSFECARKDEFGFKPRNKICIICNTSFLISKQLRSQDKYCSDICRKIAFKEKQEKRYDFLRTEKVIGKCKNCNINFEYNKLFKRIYCSIKCQSKILSKNRKGKKNPNYKAGLYLGYKKTSRQNSIHMAACQKYRRHFLNKNSYLFCEICNVNSNGTQQFQVHHIYFASKVPRHKNLHNFKNLIMVCLSCHHKFHAGKTYEKEFKKLEKDRKLKELFKNKIYG